MGSVVDYDELLALAVAAAGEAAAFLLAGVAEERSDVGTKSTLTDMVTEMDRASERLILDRLLAARPGDGVLGEEGGERPGSSGVRWVVDPIDGTTNYLYAHPGWSVSVAAQLDGRTVAGVVHDPVLGDVFAATLGGGATRNRRPIAVSAKADLPTALIATGFGYDPARRRAQALTLAEVLPQVRDVRRVGSAALDLCSVACGRVDAYYERGLGPWDMASGVLIAREAGAEVSDLAGNDPSGDFVLAAPPALFAPLCAILAAAGADRG